ncbi:MAG: thiol reductant ABC exporter subunit CydC [Streptococcaceae bacterium]|jgi:ATP-binding cassette subfamily C protein CydC|nr:thiol reductant ABC exporter subunit CydC [Streptococcaceae bacterium]
MKDIVTNSWIGPYLRKYKWGLALAILLGLLTMLCAGLLMFSAGYVISKSATKPDNILIIYVPVLFVRIFGIARPLLRYIERLTSHNWILKLTSDLRRKLYLRLETRAVSLAQDYQLGDLLGILNQDIANLQDLYLRTIFPVLIAGSLSVALIIASSVFSIWMALGLALILALLYFVIPIVSMRRMRARDEKLKSYHNQLFTELTDNVLGLQDWRLSNRKADFLARYTKAESQVRGEQKQIFSFARKRGLVLQVIFGLLVVFFLVISTTFLKHGEAANYIAAVALFVFPLFDAYSPLSDALVETNRYVDSAARLDALPQENTMTREEVISGNDIVLTDLRFAYADHEVIKAINLQVTSGEKIAILGRSGVGKSTLAGLIRGDLAPSSGKITIGGANATKAKDMEQHIGVINQSPYLFATTLRNNLTLAKLEANDAEIWQALEIVGLKEMVKALPEQLETMVDEAGNRFSGGERQRLALARILLSNVPIIILDEPTVSLDPITENQLLTLFFEALKDKTLIFITHHLLGVNNVNRVLFLEKGEVVIDGKPEVLLVENEKFKKLYALDKGL